jgi:hypothetical protein
MMSALGGKVRKEKGQGTDVLGSCYGTCSRRISKQENSTMRLFALTLAATVAASPVLADFIAKPSDSSLTQTMDALEV